MTIDIYETLGKITACTRCKCLSCIDGYENHEHYCTDGEDCVESRRNLLKWQRQTQFMIMQIYDQMREVERKLQG